MEKSMREKLEKFLHDKDRLKNLRKLVAAGKKSLVIDFDQLLKFDMELTKALLNSPSDFLESADAILTEITKLPGMHLRVRDLDQTVNIRDIRAKDVGKFIQVEGILTRASEVKPEVKEAVFKCLRCGEENKVMQVDEILRQPLICENPNCAKKGPFKLVIENSEFRDWQTMRLQERPEELRGGRMPRQLDGIVRDDFVDKAVPGNHVILTGTLHVLQEVLRGQPRQRRRTFRKILFIDHIDVVQKGVEETELKPEDEEQIKELAKDRWLRNKIIASIAPSIFGYEPIKEAIALQLFGCPAVELPDGTRIRGDSHILLTGDPGCLIADERIVLGNGAIMKIGDLGSEHLQPLKQQVLIGQGYRRALATRFHVYRDQPILEIVTETGRSIKGTFNHPLLVLEKQRSRKFPCPPIRKWKRLDEIRPGDRVVTVPWIPCTITAPVETGWRPLTRKFGPRPKCRLPPRLDEDVAALLGYVLGDGWVRRTRVGFNLNHEEEDLLPLLSSIIERKFGLALKVRRIKQKHGCLEQRKIRRKHPLLQAEAHSVDVAANLSFLREKRVPSLVLKSGNGVVAEFLAWLFEADGSVFSKGRRRMAIQLKAKNIELLRDVQMLLTRFGIHSRILGNNLVIRRAESIFRFSETISFRSKKKRARLARLVGDCKNRDPRKLRKKERSERVVIVRPAGRADVYDIEVPGSHRFIANGIVSHNTAKSQILKWVSQVAPRGLYTSGKKVTGAGLCVAPETIVCYSNGSMKKIGDHVREVFGRRDPSRIDEGIWRAEVKEPGLTLGPDLKLKNAPITALWRLRSPNRLLRLRTRLGYTLTLTPETRLLMIENGSLRWSKSCDLKIGGSVATARSLSIIKEQPTPLVYLLDTDPHVIGAKRFVSRILDKLRKKYGSLRNVAKVYGVQEDLLYSNWRNAHMRGSVSLNLLKKFVQDCGYSPQYLAANVNKLSEYHGHIVHLPSYPTPEFMYFVGLVAGDGHIGKTPKGGCEIRFTAANTNLREKYVRLVHKIFGLRPKVRKDVIRPPEVRFFSKIVGILMMRFGVPTGDKADKITVPDLVTQLGPMELSMYIRGLFDSDSSVVNRTNSSGYIEFTTTSADLAQKLQLLLLRFNVRSKLRFREPSKKSSFKSKAGIRRIHPKKMRFVLTIYGKENLLAFKRNIGFGHREKAARLDDALSKSSEANPNLDIIPGVGPAIRQVRRDLGAPPSRVYGWTSGAYELGRRNPSRKKLENIIHRIEAAAATCDGGSTNMDTLKKLASSDIYWDRIVEIETISSESIPFVYDVTVDGAHNFIANGFIVHNTAAAVRDEIGGGWALEAGALVIADGGMACIDEFDKMSPEDAGAILESMEQQTVSVAKAGIVATLNTRTAVLAAANPTLGRFDRYRSLAEQINLPPLILSRFDLIFIMRDVPQAELDREIATHILELHREPARVKPPKIDPDTLRKLIIYARKYIHPKFESKEVIKTIKDFYVNWRNVAEKGELPIPITARQLEALVRLAKANARMRLADTVTVEDAKTAIRLVTLSLKEAGIDPETGKVDIDVLLTGKTRSQRQKLERVLEIIKQLESDFEGVAPIDEIKRLATAEGIRESFVTEMIEREKMRGHLYEPKPGMVSRAVK